MMGTDIHFYRERKIDGNWITADEWEICDYDENQMEVPYEKQGYNDRNYNLFGILAGVRRAVYFSFVPRGLPLDVSTEVKQAYINYEGGLYKPSYLYLHELKDLKEYLVNKKLVVSGMKDREELKALKTTLETDCPDYNLLYPFCEWPNNENYERFEVEIPAIFMVGKCLENIISSFDSVGDGADNARAVFWFC